MTDIDSVPVSELREALIQGDYAQLPRLITALEEIEGGLESASPARLGALKAEALRTAACLDAALSGMKAARRRVAEIAEAARGLTIYARDGSKATVSNTLQKPRRV